MLIIRIVIFFLMVLMVSTYVTHQMSIVFLNSALQAKNEVINQQKETIKHLMIMNADKDIVIENTREIIKDGVKSGCLKYSEATD